MKIIFPDSTNRYYDLHFRYLLNMLQYAGCEVSFEKKDPFEVIVDDKKTFFDYADMSDLDMFSEQNKDDYTAGFKYHYTGELTEPKLKPFCPISFYDWDRYNELYESIKYKCNNDLILLKQRAYAGAKARRGKVRNSLQAIYGDNIDLNFKDDQVTFWNKINNCLVAVFVPGQNNNMLDRGHAQYMAFGCCTISPNLPEILPFNEKIIPDWHYIRCADDYSDLVDKIEWCKTHREECIDIGINAKNLFNKCCVPDRLVDWIKENV